MYIQILHANLACILIESEDAFCKDETSLLLIFFETVLLMALLKALCWPLIFILRILMIFIIASSSLLARVTSTDSPELKSVFDTSRLARQKSQGLCEFSVKCLAKAKISQ